MWIAAGLILLVVGYELVAKRAPASTGQSAARAGARPVTTGAAQTTSALAAIEKGIAALLNPKQQAQSSSRPTAGMSPGSGGSSSASSPRPSQTGFQMPSNQVVNTNPAPYSGLQPFGNGTFIDPVTGQVFNAAGQLVSDNTVGDPNSADLSAFEQSAPGDGTYTSPGYDNAELAQNDVLPPDDGYQDQGLMYDTSGGDYSGSYYDGDYSDVSF